MQYFKGDETEVKIVDAGTEVLDNVSMQKDLFYEGAYEAAPLGDVLYESERSPLANAISQDIFRDSFAEIFEAFIVSGSFESYLTVFRKIFGEEAVVTFTVPAPGRLQILIEAIDVELSPFLARYIDANQYFFDNVVFLDDDSIEGEDNYIVFQTIKGFHTQYELEQMLFELVPAGIFTEITLELLGA